MSAPYIIERPRTEIRQTTTAAGSDSESLFKMRKYVKTGYFFNSNPELDGDHIKADFLTPRSKELMANEQHLFITSVHGPYYDVELPEED